MQKIDYQGGFPIKNSVKELREKRGMTQQQLATEVVVSRQMISYIEKGTKKPTIILALKIAKFFNKPVEEIFELDSQD
ncbi:MAG: helix-turn-helix transcriptional regulator [Promethearchaeota archaeon]